MTSFSTLLPRPVRALLLIGAAALGVLIGCGGETSPDASSSADAEPEIESPTFPSPDTLSTADTLGADVPYVPTPQPVVDRMLEMAEVDENDVVYDLGSGDGRIVIRAAEKYGSRGVGIEIDPERVQEARENAKEAGVSDLVEFRQGDLFEADISEATVVTLYLLPEVNLKLRPLLFEQLRPGTPVVSHGVDMAAWEPDETDAVNANRIYRWTIPEEVPPHLQ